VHPSRTAAGGDRTMGAFPSLVVRSPRVIGSSGQG
jgi:hypothetical protein